MKFVFVFVALACANLYFCGNASGNQRPSAHIEAANKQAKYYSTGSVIKDWDPHNTHSHLAGGMTYSYGKLTVPTTGLYYIYAQLFFYGKGRVHVKVNSDAVILMQPAKEGSTRETVEAGGLFKLNAGDVIMLKVELYSTTILMWKAHTYFGAILM